MGGGDTAASTCTSTSRSASASALRRTRSQRPFSGSKTPERERARGRANISSTTPSMARYSERDPLLPQNNRSPEIHGSRPQSINYDGDVFSPSKAEAQDSSEEPARQIFNDVMASILGLCIFISFGLIAFHDDIFRDREPIPETISKRVERILTNTPLIDGHNDLAIVIRLKYNNHIYGDDFKNDFEKGGMYGQVDLPRLKTGMSGGSFWSAWTPCPADPMDFSDANYAESVAFTLTQIDVLTRLQSTLPYNFSPALNSSTALTHFSNGLYLSPIGIEGLHQIGNSLSNLRHYHSLGVRYSTLTHNCHNKYADSALTELPHGRIKISTPYWNGVSPSGRDLIFEMNRLGMIVDLAHTSQETMRDVLGGSEEWSGSIAPVIFSHSSAYSICPHPRNVPDDILHLVKEKNSLVMINFSPDFVSCKINETDPNGLPVFDEENSTLEHVVDHMVHIGGLIGWEYVGIGSDFDGIPATPRGLEDVSRYPDLIAELLKRGVGDEDVELVVGGNLLRVWGEVDRVAERMQREGVLPVEDELPALIPPDY